MAATHILQRELLDRDRAFRERTATALALRARLSRTLVLSRPFRSWATFVAWLEPLSPHLPAG
eukprot:9065743-Heterocapsa_arctica.AAC.1